MNHSDLGWRGGVVEVRDIDHQVLPRLQRLEASEVKLGPVHRELRVPKVSVVAAGLELRRLAGGQHRAPPRAAVRARWLEAALQAPSRAPRPPESHGPLPHGAPATPRRRCRGRPRDPSRSSSPRSRRASRTSSPHCARSSAASSPSPASSTRPSTTSRGRPEGSPDGDGGGSRGVRALAAR